MSRNALKPCWRIGSVGSKHDWRIITMNDEMATMIYAGSCQAITDQVEIPNQDVLPTLEQIRQFLRHKNAKTTGDYLREKQIYKSP
jgi:hypothetical protein